LHLQTQIIAQKGFAMRCDETCELDGATDLIALNQSCFCMTLGRAELDAAILEHAGNHELGALLAARPNLFAATAVFVSPADLAAMQAQVAAIEAVAALAPFQDAALARSSDRITGVQTGTRGLFMGYDFHISEDGPKLIEVNTNAGGAFLVNALQRAVAEHAVACGDARLTSSDAIDTLLMESFIAEWQAAGREGRPDTLAIVDEDASEQYLYPDMLLARDLLTRNGIETLILGPKALTFENGVLTSGGRTIDMVYNRLTDFDLSEPGNAHLRAALLEDAAIVSPAPRHHALYADKQNLIWLSDADLLESWSADAVHRAALSKIPGTRRVTEAVADELWTDRRGYFFKPAAGFGSRATYRGDKLTKRVWADILAGNYIAQALIAPTMRAVTVAGERITLKYDVRLYTYAGETLLLAARVYQGQTTNFRTSGGGFAPVYQF